MKLRFLRLSLAMLLLSVYCGFGQSTGYRLFDIITPSTDAATVSCFMQDTEGMMWIGSNRGLFSYDGYSTLPHYTVGEQSNSCIYCAQVVDSTYLYIGSDNGLLIYNYRTDNYETPPAGAPTDVRAMALVDSVLWLGTLNGLYTWNLSSQQLTPITRGIPHSTVYSLLHASDETIYIGTYNGCCRYTPSSDSFDAIPLPLISGRNSLLVNSLLEDEAKGCIWIGTEGALYQYLPDSRKTEQIEAFNGNSVKSLALDGSGQLLVGTDNGLYIYHGGGRPQHVVHDSRNPQSLSNNIVWSIFVDREQNVWLGTDHSISLARHNTALRYVPISQITDNGEGNEFYSILRDSHGTYWFGGSNGLIRCELPYTSSVIGAAGDVAWYKMDSPGHLLSHNRVRDIYEDRSGGLWVATDGSISRYDNRSRQFVRYNITDSTCRYNANWAYSLFEDERGRLWIGTCLGGIFVVDKEKLVKTPPGKVYRAEKNYTTDNGLAGMFINHMIPDQRGNVWVLLYNAPHVIEKVDTRSGRITHIDTRELTRGQAPNYLICDEQGDIWVGFPGGVLRIDPADDSCSAILFNNHTHFTVLSMIEAFNRVWVSTTDGLWVIEKETEYVRRLSLTDKRFTATYFDHRTGDLFLGTIDGFAISSPDALLVKNAEQPFMLTALYANNQLHNPSRRSVRYLSEVEFPYDYNNLSFEISDLPYSKEEKTSLIYRMAGLDSRWNVLKSNTNRITYNNLPFGRYRLEVGEADLSGNPQSVRYALSVHITPPWYYSWWAIVIYLLLLGALVIWTLNFFRIKQNLRWERQDKEEIVKNSKAKLRTVAAVPVREDKAVTQDEKFIHQIAQLIEEHLPDPELSVNALCEWTDTGSKQLYRKVKQLTGLTPVEYIKTIRLKKAAVLLRQQKYSVADVMYKVGYSNHSYFSRCFQAEFGVTPKAYKEEVTRT